MSSARRQSLNLLLRISARLACAAVAIGCKPIEVVQPAPGVVQPPVAGGVGAMVDPFAWDPNGPPMAGPLLVGPPMAGLAAGSSSQIHVPVVNHDWTWEQIVDAVDDYFRIERERQVQLVGDVLTEGRIDAFPRIGATVLEPHRGDSAGAYNRWESTFQTIRRRATVRVIPDATGYVIDVAVEKDLEDLPRPEYATAGAATFRNDSSLPSVPAQAVSRTRLSDRWILIGRDPELEQRMLADIQSRLTVQAAR